MAIHKLSISFLKRVNTKTGGIYIYLIDGPKDLIRKHRGDFYAEDELGRPLYFTSQFQGKYGYLLVNPGGDDHKVVPA